jgi:hypothetical protein
MEIADYNGNTIHYPLSQYNCVILMIFIYLLEATSRLVHLGCHFEQERTEMKKKKEKKHR